MELKKRAFSFYQLSWGTILGHAFGMLINRFGIFWSSMKMPLHTSSRTNDMTFKLLNLMLDMNENGACEPLSTQEYNNVAGSSQMYFQSDPEMEDSVRGNLWGITDMI